MKPGILETYFKIKHRMDIKIMVIKLSFYDINKFYTRIGFLRSIYSSFFCIFVQYIHFPIKTIDTH